MADVTTLCNQALAAVGTRSTISSINEASNEARQLLIQFDPTRKHLLRAAHWGFARAYTALSVLKARYGTPENPGPPPAGYFWSPASPEPPPPWLFAYSLPTKYLALRYILPTSASEVSAGPPIFGTQGPVIWPENMVGPMVKFEITTLQHNGAPVVCILTNMPKALACFTTDVTDPNQFDETFSRAFVQALASNVCQPLTGDLKLADALIKITNSIILEARVKSANEGLTALDIMPDWLRVRGLGPAVGTGPWTAEYGPLFGGVL